MSWVTVVWSAVGATCLTLSVQHLLIGFRQGSRAHLLFALTGVSAAAVAAFELALMLAGTGHAYGTLLKWIHAPIFVLIVSLILFVRTFLRAGRPWLAGTVIAVRAAVLVVDLLRSPNLNFVVITGVRRVAFLGEEVSVADGLVSRWTRLGELGSLLLLVFLLDAVATVWRRGERRRAVLVGGSMILFVLGAAGQVSLVHAGILSSPYLISLAYLPIVVAMSHELSRDVLRSGELARELAEREAALRESERRLALAAGAANLGFWLWDVATDEVWMTPGARGLRGFSTEERLDHRRFLSTVHPEDRERLGEVLDAAAGRGGGFETEYRLVRPDGEIRWIALHGAGERDPAGGVRVRGVSVDITDAKRSEIESQRRQSEVAHLSRVTVLGELAGSLAHELNQPLTAILSNAQAAQRLLAREGGSSEEVREILADIVQADKHAGGVIRRLRALLRKGEVKPEPLAMGDLFEDVVKLLRSDLLTRGVSVSTDIPSDLPKVLGDRVQVEQVLLNLVANGCDAMAATPAGQRRLAVRAEALDGAEVRVSVSDRGSGIPAERLDHIFEPFMTTKARGLGLGLAVCRTIVSAHGGRLSAGNNAEGGATFSFTLPISGARPS